MIEPGYSIRCEGDPTLSDEILAANRDAVSAEPRRLPAMPEAKNIELGAQARPRQSSTRSPHAVGQPYFDAVGARAGASLMKRNVGTRPMRVIADIIHQTALKACTCSSTA